MRKYWWLSHPKSMKAPSKKRKDLRKGWSHHPSKTGCVLDFLNIKKWSKWSWEKKVDLEGLRFLIVVETGALNQQQSSCFSGKNGWSNGHGKFGSWLSHDKQKLGGPTNELNHPIPYWISGHLGSEFHLQGLSEPAPEVKGAAPKAWKPSKKTWFLWEKKVGNHKIIPRLLMGKNN